jgi:chitinase
MQFFSNNGLLFVAQLGVPLRQSVLYFAIGQCVLIKNHYTKTPACQLIGGLAARYRSANDGYEMMPIVLHIRKAKVENKRPAPVLLLLNIDRSL